MFPVIGVDRKSRAQPEIVEDDPLRKLRPVRSPFLGVLFYNSDQRPGCYRDGSGKIEPRAERFSSGDDHESQDIDQMKDAMRAPWIAGNFGAIAKTIGAPDAEGFVARLALEPDVRVLDIAAAPKKARPGRK